MLNNAKRRKNIFNALSIEARTEAGADALIECAMLPVDKLIERLATSIEGLTELEAAQRLQHDRASKPQTRRPLMLPSGVIAASYCLPLLVVVVLYLFSIGDTGLASLLILVSVLGFGGGLLFGNTSQNANAHDDFDAPVLVKRRLRSQATTDRTSDGSNSAADFQAAGELIEVPAHTLVVGDIVHLSAIESGHRRISSVIAADMRLLAAHHLLVDQRPLSGGMFREFGKSAEVPAQLPAHPLDLPNICFAGSRLLAGNGIAAVIAIGADTYHARAQQTI